MCVEMWRTLWVRTGLYRISMMDYRKLYSVAVLWIVFLSNGQCASWVFVNNLFVTNSEFQLHWMSEEYY